MTPRDRVRAGLAEAIDGAAPGLMTADRLCRACVELLGVDGAAISLVMSGLAWGTFGSSGELSRRLDEYQFTYGEGPCLDSARLGVPVLVADFRAPGESRWPGYAEAVLAEGVRAVYALPIAVDRVYVGALDLFRHRPGPLGGDGLGGGLVAAELAALPLLDLVAAEQVQEYSVARNPVPDVAGEVGPPDPSARLEVYQATGMVMIQLGVSADEALVRLRGHAIAHGQTASEVAWAIIERRLHLPHDGPGAAGPGPDNSDPGPPEKAST